jgi:H+/Cl- antiporter ClcA
MTRAKRNGAVLFVIGRRNGSFATTATAYLTVIVIFFETTGGLNG